MEAAAFIRAAGRETASRVEAVRTLQDSTAQILKALESVTPALLETSPDSPFGPMPFTAWMHVLPSHMIGHARQIDYLQTIWGDVQDH